jgi:hypothetical protein
MANNTAWPGGTTVPGGGTTTGGAGTMGFNPFIPQTTGDGGGTTPATQGGTMPAGSDDQRRLQEALNNMQQSLMLMQSMTIQAQNKVFQFSNQLNASQQNVRAWTAEATRLADIIRTAGVSIGQGLGVSGITNQVMSWAPAVQSIISGLQGIDSLTVPLLEPGPPVGGINTATPPRPRDGTW